MKWVIAALSLAAGMAPLAAQDAFVAPPSPQREVAPPPENIDRPSIEGIIAEVFKNKQPLQLINPLAPKEYGNGQRTVSWSEEDPGKPKGFIFLGFAW